MWILYLLLTIAFVLLGYEYFRQKKILAGIEKSLMINCKKVKTKDKDRTFVLTAIEKMLQNCNKLEEKAQKAEKCNLYCEVMDAVYNEASDAEVSKRNDMQMYEHSGKNYMVLMLGNLRQPMKERKDLTVIISKILNRRQKNGEIFLVNDIYICVIYFDEADKENNTKDAYNFANHVIRLCKRLYDFDIFAAIGSVKRDASELREAVKEVKKIFDYHIVLGTESVLDSGIVETYNGGIKNGYYYPCRVDAAISNSIKNGDVTGAMEKIEKITERNFSVESLSPKDAELLFLNILLCIDRSLRELKINLLDFGTVKNRHIGSNPEQFMCFINNVLLQAETVIKHDRQQSEALFYIEVEDFVKTNFSDCTLNISSIAEHFKISPTYLSKVFKEQTGKRLFDYISEYRIEEAKKLLKKDKATVLEVMKKVGYFDAKTFTRSFKNIVGITPGKYKSFDEKESIE